MPRAWRPQPACADIRFVIPAIACDIPEQPTILRLSDGENDMEILQVYDCIVPFSVFTRTCFTGTARMFTERKASRSVIASEERPEVYRADADAELMRGSAGRGNRRGRSLAGSL